MKHHPMWETIMNPVPVYKSFWPKIGVTIVVYDADDLLYVISLLFVWSIFCSHHRFGWVPTGLRETTEIVGVGFYAVKATQLMLCNNVEARKSS